MSSCHRRCRKSNLSGTKTGHSTAGSRSTVESLETPARELAPILSDNPTETEIVVFKQLSGFPNYGNPSRNADILYTGNQGTWTLNTPSFLLLSGGLDAKIIIRAVLDDHLQVPLHCYTARITINGNVVHNGRLFLEHGMPVGGIFTNWRDLTFSVPPRASNRVKIENTSTAVAGDWIGLDWIELRLRPR